MIWWQSLIIAIVPAILVAFLTNVLTKNNFKYQLDVEKQNKIYENMIPILQNCVNQRPLLVIDTLSQYKSCFFVYGSKEAIIIVKKIMELSFRNFKPLIEAYQKNRENNTIDESENFKNFKCILPYMILLYSQIKYDLSKVIVSPLIYIELYFYDLTEENRKIISQNINSIIHELKLNKKFKIKLD